MVQNLGNKDWLSLVAVENRKDIYTDIIYNIQEIVLKKNFEINKIATLEGSISIPIFLHHFSTFAKLNLSQEINHRVEHIVQSLSTTIVTDEYLDGLAGFGWGINYLQRKEALLFDVSELLSQLDQYLIQKAEAKFAQSNNCDLFYGLVGFGMYFLERYKSSTTALPYLQKITRLLLKKRQENSRGFFWRTESGEEDAIELSISHGQAMILYFLTKVFQIRNQSILSQNDLLGMTQYLNSFLHEKEYPDIIEAGKAVFSPLRWCHGSLGISMVLFQVSKIIQNETIGRFALQAGLACAKIRENNLEDTLPQPILCHGTLGLAHMFNRFYNDTYHPVFKEAAQYWFDHGLVQIQKDQHASYRQDIGLLLGIEGVGLTYLSAIHTATPDWDAAVLLS